MSILAALTIALLSPQEVRIGSQEAVSRISACGLGPTKIRYDALIQDAVLEVAASPDTTDAQLSCLAAADLPYMVELPPELDARYEAVREAYWAPIYKRQARDYLAANGLLDRLPEYVPGAVGDAAFAQALEELCGPVTKGALQSPYGPHTVDPAWLAAAADKPAPDMLAALSCLMSATTYAGFELGFIGNEAADE